MDEKEWRKLSLQSISLLLAVILCCVVFSGQSTGGQKELVAAQEKETLVTGDTQDKEKVAEYAQHTTQEEAVAVVQKTIVLDAGHGGMDEGTSSYAGEAQEKEYTLLLAKKVESMLSSRGIRVQMTRTKDRAVSKPARTAMANDLKADLFVSIHCNASEAGDTSAEGLECLYATNKRKDVSVKNKKLAEIMLDELANCTGQKKRGIIRRNGLYILHHAKVPATIVEVGYMTNKKDLNIIKKESGQQAIAEGICNGILKALEECE